MIITVMVVFGCLMYVLEGPENGFHNIPVSVYWAIVTITTVGYGDVVPVTAAGRAISALAMLLVEHQRLLRIQDKIQAPIRDTNRHRVGGNVSRHSGELECRKNPVPVGDI